MPALEGDTREQQSSIGKQKQDDGGQLDRHLSMPTRYKHAQGSLSEQSRALSFDKNGPQSNSEANIIRGQRQRHSLYERSSLNRQESNHKSSSPASPASASDSAFSQSQTTLESEFEQPNCFQRNLKEDFSVDRDNHIKSRGVFTVRGSVEDSLSQQLEEEDEHAKQFELIWRNLTYKVPEKRVARFVARFCRRKDFFWPKCREDPIVDEPRTAGERAESDLKLPNTGEPRRVIFGNLNGCIKSGQLTAILGPSGAGKTTFLKCLTNSIVKGVSGSIDIAGGPKTSHHLKLCIIPQKGTF